MKTSTHYFAGLLSGLMNQHRSLLLVLLVFPFSTSLTAQEDAPERIPKYPIPYEYPTVDGIKDVLHRVRRYYESSSPQKIVHAETGKEITNFSKLNPHAQVSEGFSSEWSYTHGVVLSAFDYIEDVTGDSSFFANNTRFYDFVIEHLPYFRKNAEKYGTNAGGWHSLTDMHALDDCGSIGAAMIKTYLKDKNEDYLELINITADFISNKQFRLEDGTLARHRPQYQSVWADDLYMSVPFLANMGKLTGDNAYYDDAVRQVLQMADRLYIPGKELFDHGWNVTAGEYDPRFYWGRANGWTLMTMAELLSILPEEYPGRDKILHLYRSMIRSLAGIQDGTGFWHNMLDKSDTYLETSCTAMFTFAVAKGINEGWISHIYGPVALTGWNATQSRVLKNGAVDGTCEGTTFAHDNTYYYYRGKSIYATHGYGPVLYAGAEMIRLLQNDKIEVQANKINARNSTYHYRLKSEWPKEEATPSIAPKADSKPRIIVLTDIENEPDDAMSLVRFLTYANQWDVEGLVATTSIHQQNEIASWRIREILEAYGKVRDNLEKHEKGYPTADHLLSLVREGRKDYGMQAVGKGMDSEGSELIIQAADREDTRPVWVLVWGGPNCLAQALWKVRATRTEQELRQFVSKIRVYTISDQDDSGPWIRAAFPELFYIASPGYHPFGGYHHATWTGISGDKFHGRFAGGNFEIVDNLWLDQHIRSKGPLGAEYPWAKFLMEGDSPSFMYLINNGLGDPDHPDWGSWGGRYEFYQPRTEKWFLQAETRPLWNNAQDEVFGTDSSWHTSNKATIWRWREAYQNDFSARMDWTIKSYKEANHPPVPKLGHEQKLMAKVGERVDLSAAGSSDPDGDKLSYRWFYYAEPGTFTISTARSGDPLTIEDADKANAWFIVPEKAKRLGTMHLILEVTDQGTPALTRYKRVIVTITP